jgi:hypothetical protein
MSRILDAALRLALDRHISPYVSDIGTLKTAVLSGDCALENVKLRDDLLDDLDTPFVLLSGEIGKLTLKIPMADIKGKPVVARAEGVRILLGMRSVGGFFYFFYY